MSPETNDLQNRDMDSSNRTNTDINAPTVNQQNLQAIAAKVAKLDRSHVPTGILYDPLLHTLDHGKFSGQSGEPLSLEEVFQGLHELRLSALRDEGIPSSDELLPAARDRARAGEVPMVMVHCVYEAVKIGAIKRFLVQLRKGAVLDLDDLDVTSVLEQRRATFCRPLVQSVADGAAVTFSFDRALLVSNTGEAPLFIEFDPDDGGGVRHVSCGSQIPVSYAEAGDKRLWVRCHYKHGEATTVSVLEVLALNLPAPNETVAIQAARPHKGVYAKGTMKIYYAPGHNNVVKPLFMWTGFNTGTATATAIPTPFDIWEASAEQMLAVDRDKLLEEARQKGFDIVVIEFSDSRTYIEANGEMVITAIKMINRRPSKTEPGVVITGSMGGLVARYALVTMENEREDAGIEKAVFLDTPFYGAVVPMAVQYQLDFFADVNGTAQQLRDEVLDSPAARQMLVQKYRPSWTGQEDPQPDDLFHELQKTFIDRGGWPRNTELYAVTSGNNRGLGQLKNDSSTLEPKDFLLDFTRRDNHGTWCAGGKLQAMPNFVKWDEAGFEIVWASRAFKLDWKARVKKTLPWDSCPGGYAGFVGQLASQGGWTEKNLKASNTCFVPTLSALGVQPIDDLYMIVSGPAKTPFKDFHTPQQNEQHATLTTENTAWIKKILAI